MCSSPAAVCCVGKQAVFVGERDHRGHIAVHMGLKYTGMQRPLENLAM